MKKINKKIAVAADTLIDKAGAILAVVANFLATIANVISSYS